MSQVAAEVDAEQLLVAHLLAQSDVTALVGQRIHTELPANAGYPLVVLFRVSGVSKTQEWLDDPVIQVEAWAEVGDRLVAKQVATALRVALGPSRLIGVHALGVVTDSREERGPLPSPDPPTGRPRFTFDLGMTLHPNPTG